MSQPRSPRSRGSLSQGKLNVKKPLVIVDKTSGNYRIFKALQDREYAGPQTGISVEESNKSVGGEARTPVFLGSDGTLYDLSYSPLDKEDIERSNKYLSDNILNQSTDYAQSKKATPFQLYESVTALFSEMPKADLYENFFDYEQALLDWKVQVETAVGTLRLPNIMGRHYYRPRIILERTRGASDSNAEFNMEGAGMSPAGPSSPSFSPRDNLIKSDINAEIAANEAVEKIQEEEDEELYRRISPDMSKSQFISVLRKKKGSSSNELVDFRNIQFDKDPWDSILVPEEPDPNFYDTYEDYECAMRRWASLCGDLSIIPPHAGQLKDLIPIQTAELNSTGTASVPKEEEKKPDNSINESFKSQTGLKLVPFFLNPAVHDQFLFEDKKSSIPSALSRSSSTTDDIKNQWNSLLPSVQEQLRALISSLLKQQNENLEKHKSYNRPLLPVIHGSFPKPWAQGATSPIARKQGAKNKALRRTDLTGAMITSCMDCPTEIDGKRVEFKVSDFDLESVDLGKLQSDPKYAETILLNLRGIQSSDRNDVLNSWYHPSISKEIINANRKAVDDVIAGVPSDKVTIEQVCEVLRGVMHVDKFVDVLGECLKEEDDGIARTYLQAFLNSITPDNFEKVLKIFEDTNSQVIHAKVASFVSEILQSSKAKSILEKLIHSQDSKNFSLVAYAMSFSSEIPIDIFPLHADSKLVVSKLLGPSACIIDYLFCYYYLSLISQVISKQPFIFVAINQFVTESRKSLAVTLSNAIQEKPEFLSSQIWKLLNHRSSTVSSFALFMIVQLLNQQDATSLISLLKADTTDFINNVRTLAKSKYLHAQYAAKRLFSILQGKDWIDFMYSKFTLSGEVIFEDLVAPLQKDGKISIITRMMQDMILDSFAKVNEGNMHKITFLLDESLFIKILKHLLAHAKTSNETTVVLSKILAVICKVFVKLNLFTANDRVKNTPVKLRKNKLGSEISPLDLQKINQFISEVSGEDDHLTYRVKTNGLKILRYTVRPQVVFECIRKEADFWSKLNGFCRDGTSIEFNRESWKLFYEAIFYHAGVLDYISSKSANILPGFLDLVGTASNSVVIPNGLHYTSKLFSMLATEQRKMQAGLPSTRGEAEKERTKSYEKDVKTINSIFVQRSLFIKIHMIYKKLTPTTSGSSFLELANFYHTLASNNVGSQKLYKDTMKKAEYKQGLLAISTMFTPEGIEQDKESPSVAKMKKVTTALSSMKDTVMSKKH